MVSYHRTERTETIVHTVVINYLLHKLRRQQGKLHAQP